MAKETAVENGRISNFQGLVTFTLDRVILHTIVHHSSTSIYIPNFIEIKGTFCGQTDVYTHVHMEGRTDKQTFETHFIRSTQKSRPEKTQFTLLELH